jgi:ABC-type phosphate transport system substrate-binding protein
MKIKALAAAVAMVAAGNAAAIQVHTTGTVDFVVNISGATASTFTIREVVTNEICDSQIDVYNSDENWVVACVVKPEFQVGTEATSVLFRKADTGSSGGVGPLDLSLPVPMTLPGADCAAVPGSSPQEWECSNDPAPIAVSDLPNGIVNTIPDIGTSDVEPALFTGSLAGSSGSFQNLSSVDTRALAGLGFGVVATTSLRNALQEMQFPGVDTWTIEMRESQEYMPSLTSSTLRSLFTGQVASWNDLKNGDGQGLFEVVNFADGSVIVPTGGPQVHVCRRAAGSGTHATIAAEILGTNCAVGQTASMVSLLGGLDETTAPGVTEVRGSSDMSRCLNAAETGVISGSYRGNNNPATNVWAIGYQSLEKGALTIVDGMAMSSEDLAEEADHFRFIKIDGYAPTLDNIHRGQYTIFSQSSMQTRGDTAGPKWNDSIVAAGAQAQVQAVFEKIAADVGDASTLDELNALPEFAHNFALGGVPGGWLGDPRNPNNTPDLKLDGINPVNSYSRAFVNTCQNPISPLVDPATGLRIAD